MLDYSNLFKSIQSFVRTTNVNSKVLTIGLSKDEVSKIKKIYGITFPYYPSFTKFFIFGLQHLFRFKIKSLERKLQLQRKGSRGSFIIKADYEQTIDLFEKYQKRAGEDGILI